MQRFEDLKVWQKAQEFFLELDVLFKNSKDFFFRDQILRAGLSISNNIAEGYERRSDKEFRSYLFVSKGSSGEVRSMLYLACKHNKLNKEERDQLIIKSEDNSKMLAGLIKKMDI
jgi:four helix bundle protein